MLPIAFIYQICCILAFLVLAYPDVETARKRACYDNSTASLDNDLSGEWIKSTMIEDHLNFLSNATDIDSWFKTACPVELITASCFLRNTTRAHNAQRRSFEPKDCAFENYTPESMLERLRNKKVLFVFDGVVKQFWSYLVCHLRLADKAEFNVEWIQGLAPEEMKSCPRGGEHCRFSSAKVHFPKYKTTFLYQHLLLHGKMSHKRLDILGMFGSLDLKRGDLVVANFGHNFHDDGHIYRNFLRKFSDDYEYGMVKMHDSMPALVWIETSAQHFPNSTRDNGYHAEALGSRSSLLKCSEYRNIAAYSTNDFRNQIAREVMHAASIPVLRNAASSASQFDIHLEELDFRGHKHIDCTHFCSNSALFRHWTVLLYNSLPALFSSTANTPITNSAISTLVPETSKSLQISEEKPKKEPYTISLELIAAFHNVTNNFVSQNKLNSVKYGKLTEGSKLSGIYLTTGKDLPVFKKSIESALNYLTDVHIYFVICPKAQDLRDSLAPALADLKNRVIFIDESSFPLTHEIVADVILETVKQVGMYPLNNGQSLFEKFLWSKLGWFYQQVVKLYAGEYLGIENYVLLDSDIIWFRNITFRLSGTEKFNYAYSTQWHGSYRASMKHILGIDHTPGAYYSGICHHMVILKTIMDEMKSEALRIHSVPLWQMMLNASAKEITCRSPRAGICGGGSTLSEYDMYFHFARQKFPGTVNLRPLIWANGPKYGMLYNPPDDQSRHPDSHRHVWLDFRADGKEEAFQKQTFSDKAVGFDYVAYHNYAKRRYYELLHSDIDNLCAKTQLPVNGSTCSWVHYNETSTDHLTEKWWNGCLCFNLLNRVTR